MVAALTVVAALASWGGGALSSAQAVPAPSPGATPADTGAPVEVEVLADVEQGPVDVIVVTSAPGEQVAEAVMGEVPDESVSAVDASVAPQLAVTVDAEGLEALRTAPCVERIVESKDTSSSLTVSARLMPLS